MNKLLARMARAYGRGYRVLLPNSTCHARGADRGTCTKLGELAFLTYGIGALGYALMLSGDCQSEHHDR